MTIYIDFDDKYCLHLMPKMLDFNLIIETTI